MSIGDSISISLNDESFKLVYSTPYKLVNKKSNTFKILEKIKEMRFHMDKMYIDFCNNSMDYKMRKEIEEFNKIRKKEKLRQKNLIKELRIYFSTKVNKEYKIKSKSTKNILNMRTIYLFHLKKEEIIRINCITEFKYIKIIKKIKAKSKAHHAKKDFLFSYMRKKKERTLQKIKEVKSKNNSDYINYKNKSFFINRNQIINRNLLSSNIGKYTTKNRFSSKIIYKNKENDNKFNSLSINSRNIYKINYPFTPKITPKNNNEQIRYLLNLKKSGSKKIYPLINHSVYSSIKKSNSFKRQINYFQKELSFISRKSQKKKTKILEKYFKDFRKINIKSTIGDEKKKSKKQKYKYIYEDKKGKINKNFDFVKRDKNNLIFVKDYNKLRNRKRKTNQVYENLGYGVHSSSKEKNFFEANYLI